MPVEIRELRIKGIVSNSIHSRSAVVKEFENRNSNIINSSIIKVLREEILNECRDIIANEFDKQNQR
ncbi:DUF5908 family protein [Portibacter marinus]|uniref:DUF5908 family protein n=1 Tax=Portibacter marinus TaxID=2898660 RepID=UPI001F42954E|nr:DUF5908 family protein [Portibacter marinus]